MNKEQIEAHFRNGNNMAACLLFADAHNLPASEVYGFLSLALDLRERDFEAMKAGYDQAASALEDCRRKLSTALKVTTEGTIQHLQTPAESPR